MSNRPILTPDDHELLQQLMSTLIGSRSAFAAILREKLGGARVTSPGNFDAGVATIGSIVAYRTGETAGLVRAKLSRRQTRSAFGTLSVLEPHGLALLGLKAGDSITIPGSNRHSETLFVEAVDNDDQSSGTLGGLARSVVPFPGKRRAASAPLFGNDDLPGPTAA